MKTLGEAITFTTEIFRENSFTSTSLGVCNNQMQVWVNNDYIEGEKEYKALIEWVYFLGMENEDAQQIGIWIKNNTLTDYDGVFSFPKQAVKLLNKNGIRVPREFRH